MKGVSHVVLGGCAALGLHLVQPYLPGKLPVLALVVVANELGSLLPGIDSDEATIRQLSGTARSDSVLGWLVSMGMRLLGGHRALTHTLLVAASWESVPPGRGGKSAGSLGRGVDSSQLLDIIEASPTGCSTASSPR